MAHPQPPEPISPESAKIGSDVKQASKELKESRDTVAKDLMENKFLDLPKLLDVCAIYSHDNEELTRTLVTNPIKVQPHIKDGFPILISHFVSIVQIMYERCNSTLEVMDFINDSVVSLDSFVNAYKQSVVFFSSPVEMSYGNEELLATLARIHDSLLPSLLGGFHMFSGQKEISSDVLSNGLKSLKMMSTRIASFGWRLLFFCYLSDEAFENSNSLSVSMKMFPANVEDPVVRADILMQMIRDVTVDHNDCPFVPIEFTL